MLVVSTRGRYAIRVMMDLAEQGSEKFVPLEEISEREGISKKYLEFVLKSLVKNNLLKGMRGKGGGYKLTRPPEDYTVAEILELTEEMSGIVDCLKSNAPPCEKKAFCKTLPMWKKYDELTRDFFSGITLKDLLSN